MNRAGRVGANAAIPCVACAIFLGCATQVATTGPQAQDATRPVPVLTDAERAGPADCKDTWIAAATGRVTDDLGTPIEGASVGYCVYSHGAGTCLASVKTNKGGWYSYTLEPSSRCVERLVVRTYAPAATNLRLSEAYCKPALTPKDAVLDVEADTILYTLAAPAVLPALGDAKEARTVTFPGDIEVTVVPDGIIEGNQYARMSAAVIDLGAAPCFVPKEFALDGLVAFSPNMNVNMSVATPKKIGFRLPAFGLAEGTVVDLYILGGLATQLDVDHFLDEGEFVKFGTGKVQGGRVVPDTGSELPALTVVGVRAAPQPPRPMGKAR